MNLNLRHGAPSGAETCGTICHEVFEAIAEQHNFLSGFPEYKH